MGNYVQSKNGQLAILNGSPSTFDLAFNSDNTVGNRLLVIVNAISYSADSQADCTPTITDSQGNTYTLMDSRLVQALNVTLGYTNWVSRTYTCDICVAGPNIISMTCPGNAVGHYIYFGAIIAEYSGASVQVTSSYGIGLGAIASTGDITVSSSKLIIYFTVTDSAISGDSPSATLTYREEKLTGQQYQFLLGDNNATGTMGNDTDFGGSSVNWISGTLAFGPSIPPGPKAIQRSGMFFA